MGAPTLVVLSPGCPDLAANQVGHEMRARLQELRPRLDVRAAFLDHCPPTGPQVVNRLARAGVSEIAFVPALLSSPFETDERVRTVLARARGNHPDIRSVAAPAIGPAASLLPQVDANLKTALRRNRADELDGLILLAEGAPDSRNAALLARRSRQWSQRHRLPAVGVFAAAGPGALLSAVQSLRADGRRHLAVGSLALSQDQHWLACVDAAREAGVAAIGEPLGAGSLVLELVLARYAVAAMQLVDAAAPRRGLRAGA